MTTALLCGAGIGLGLLLIIRGVIPTRVPLGAALERLHGEHLGTRSDPSKDIALRYHRAVGGSDPDGLAARIGRPLARRVDMYPLLTRTVRSDLAIMGRAPDRHLAEKAFLGLTGMLIVPAFAGLFTLGGVLIGWALPLWLAIVLGIGGFLIPDLGIHAEAKKRRADFRHAFGSFLDLVVISLAGGAGVEGALSEASAIGSGWVFALLRQTLEEARMLRIAPWGPLGRLGEELGIPELGELSATVALAGSEGAKVRATLASKAASIRSHALADAQARAEASSERMSLPVVVLFAGFLIFVGYPALAHVLAGL